MLRLFLWSGGRGLHTGIAAMTIMLAASGVLIGQAQDQPVKNPFQPTPDIIREGMAAFRANCAYCHGMDAKGARGPDLTSVFNGHTEEGLYHLVRRGIAGTEMPPASVFLQEPDTWKTLMYLRTLAAPTPTPAATGNAENGEKLFLARCASCHRVNGRGGVLGPDLTRIGSARTRPALVRQIRGAVEDIRPGYEPVTDRKSVV